MPQVELIHNDNNLYLDALHHSLSMLTFYWMPILIQMPGSTHLHHNLLFFTPLIEGNIELDQALIIKILQPHKTDTAFG